MAALTDVLEVKCCESLVAETHSFGATLYNAPLWLPLHCDWGPGFTANWQ